VIIMASIIIVVVRSRRGLDGIHRHAIARSTTGGDGVNVANHA